MARVRAVLTGGNAHGSVDGEHAGTSYWARSMRRSTGKKMQAAPLPKGQQSDADNGAERRPTESYGDGAYLGREEENEVVPEDGELTLDAWVLAVAKEEARNGGNRLSGRRPERKKTWTTATTPGSPA